VQSRPQEAGPGKEGRAHPDAGHPDGALAVVASIRQVRSPGLGDLANSGHYGLLFDARGTTMIRSWSLKSIYGRDNLPVVPPIAFLSSQVKTSRLKHFHATALARCGSSLCCVIFLKEAQSG
jgi:hypothetical protein